MRVRAYVASGDPDFASGKDDCCAMRKLGVCMRFQAFPVTRLRCVLILRGREPHVTFAPRPSPISLPCKIKTQRMRNGEGRLSIRCMDHSSCANNDRHHTVYFLRASFSPSPLDISRDTPNAGFHTAKSSQAHLGHVA